MPFNNAVVVATFLTLLAAELGDKTQLAFFALFVRSRTFGCFLGSVLGFILANMLVIPLGCIICSVFPSKMLATIGGTLMVISGFLVLIERKNERIKLFKGNIFVQSLATIFLLELGDKTNLATLAIVASTGAIVEALIGMVFAAVVLMAIALVLSTAFARILSSNRMKVLSASLMIAIGVAMLLTALGQRFS